MKNKSEFFIKHYYYIVSISSRLVKINFAKIFHFCNKCNNLLKKVIFSGGGVIRSLLLLPLPLNFDLLPAIEHLVKLRVRSLF